MEKNRKAVYNGFNAKSTFFTKNLLREIYNLLSWKEEKCLHDTKKLFSSMEFRRSFFTRVLYFLQF